MLPSNEGKIDDSVASEFRGNVVSLNVTWKNGEQHSGFGFIFGKQQGILYIATANHLLREQAVDEIAQDIEVTFFARPEVVYKGTLLGLSDSLHDVGAIAVEDTDGLSWSTEVIASKRAVRGVPVRYVGKLGAWDIPIIPGAVEKQQLPFILVQGLSVAEGTSGAPLISEDGLVGMVVASSRESTKALPISVIEDIFREAPELPWELTKKQITSTTEVPTWLTIAGGVLGAIAVGSLIGGDSNGSPVGEEENVNLTISIPVPE